MMMLLSPVRLAHRAVFVYDETGAELNYLPKLRDTTRMDFLRYHFLLTAVDGNGVLRYQVCRDYCVIHNCD